MVCVKNAKKNNNRIGYCHDCKKEIKLRGKDIENGFRLLYEDGGERFTVLKCKECFEKNPALNNYRECEVYSRVVGYLRPVRQWNFGKQREFKERKEYELPRPKRTSYPSAA